MKILIIGATRGIGKQTLKQAIAMGMQVTVLARNPVKVEEYKSKIKIIKGDFVNYEDVKNAVRGKDAVVVSVGMTPARKEVTMFSEGTENLLKAFNELKINPLLIAVTGIGAGDSAGHGGFFYDRIMKPLLLKAIYEDKNRQEKIIKDNYDNWIIVRPGFLINKSKTEKYKVLTDLTGVKAGKISRADVADFILKQIVKPEYLKGTPLLTY